MQRQRFQVVMTAWSLVQTDEDDCASVGEDEVVAQAATRDEAERIADQWAEAHAGEDVSLSVRDLDEQHADVPW